MAHAVREIITYCNTSSDTISCPVPALKDRWDERMLHSAKFLSNLQKRLVKWWPVLVNIMPDNVGPGLKKVNPSFKQLGPNLQKLLPVISRLPVTCWVSSLSVVSSLATSVADSQALAMTKLANNVSSCLTPRWTTMGQGASSPLVTYRSPISFSCFRSSDHTHEKQSLIGTLFICCEKLSFIARFMFAFAYREEPCI